MSAPTDYAGKRLTEASFTAVILSRIADGFEPFQADPELQAVCS